MAVLTDRLDSRAGAVIDATVEFPRSAGAADPSRGGHYVRLLLDTGASHTVLRRSVCELLGLKSVSDVTIATPSHRAFPSRRYKIRLQLAPKVAIDELPVLDAPLEGHDVDGLVGRDVLGRGLFVLHSPDGRWTLAL